MRFIRNPAYVALFFLITFLVGAYLYRNVYQTSKAAGETVAVTYVHDGSGSLSMSAGETKEISILLSTNSTTNKISAFDLQIVLTGSIQIVDVGTATPLGSTNSTIYQKIITNISDSSARVAYITMEPDNVISGQILVPITIRASTNAGGTLSVSTPQSVITGNILTATYGITQTNSLIVNGNNITPTSVDTENDIEIIMNPITSYILQNNVTDIEVLIRPLRYGDRLAAFGLTLENSGPISIESVSLPVAYRGSPLSADYSTTYVQNKYQIGTNEAILLYTQTVTQEEMVFADAIGFTVRVKGLQLGRGELRIKEGSDSFGIVSPDPWITLGNVDTSTIYVVNTLPTAQPTSSVPTPVVSISHFPNTTPPGTGAATPNASITGNSPPNQINPTIGPETVTLKMRLRFQGIVTATKPSMPTINVSVGLQSNANPEEFFIQNTAFKYTGRGNWDGTLTYSLIPSVGWKIYIKAEKHLQRKICDARPTDPLPELYSCANGNGNITLVKGENRLYFDNIVLFAGDIPFKGENSGVIDGFDIGTIRTSLGQKSLLIADVNYDGIVDTQDHFIAISAMQLQKYDQF